MTIGEKMVWAAVFANTIDAAQANGRRLAGQVNAGIAEAGRAVLALRAFDMPGLLSEAERALAEEMLK